jgi:hypothetical protein
MAAAAAATKYDGGIGSSSATANAATAAISIDFLVID